MKTTIICTFDDSYLAQMALRRLSSFSFCYTIHSAKELFSPTETQLPGKVISILCEEHDCPSLLDCMAAMGAQRVTAASERGC